MLTRDALVSNIEAFLARTGMSARQFGLAVNGDHKLVGRLKAGKGTLRVIEKAEAFMRNHGGPPAGTASPADSSPPQGEAA